MANKVSASQIPKWLDMPKSARVPKYQELVAPLEERVANLQQRIQQAGNSQQIAEELQQAKIEAELLVNAGDDIGHAADMIQHRAIAALADIRVMLRSIHIQAQPDLPQEEAPLLVLRDLTPQEYARMALTRRPLSEEVYIYADPAPIPAPAMPAPFTPHTPTDECPRTPKHSPPSYKIAMDLPLSPAAVALESPVKEKSFDEVFKPESDTQEFVSVEKSRSIGSIIWAVLCAIGSAISGFGSAIVSGISSLFSSSHSKLSEEYQLPGREVLEGPVR